MTDRPIIFSSPMVKSLIAGTKTQTRRVLKPQPEQRSGGPWLISGNGGGCFVTTEEELRDVAPDYCRYAVGDRLWVKESIYYGNDSNWYFEADKTGIGVDGCMAVRHFKRNKAPGMFLPRVASRLTLTVTDVRVQRLQEISEEDAVAEGVVDRGRMDGEPWSHYTVPGASPGIYEAEATTCYSILWERLHGDGAWYANPWVAALTFTCEHRNIDADAVMSRPALDALVLTEGERR